MERVVRFMRTFQGPSGLAAWCIHDEIFTTAWGNRRLSTITAKCRELANVDPYHPAFANENSAGLNFLNERRLDFPVRSSLLDHTRCRLPRNPTRLNLRQNHARKPVARPEDPVDFLFGGGYTFGASRDSDAGEQEGKRMPVINGIRGITISPTVPGAKPIDSHDGVVPGTEGTCPRRWHRRAHSATGPVRRLLLITARRAILNQQLAIGTQKQHQSGRLQHEPSSLCNRLATQQLSPRPNI